MAEKSKKRLHNLTEKQKAYAKERAKGKSYADAYLTAGYSAKNARDTAMNNAYNLENHSAASSDIKAMINRYQSIVDNNYLMDRKQRQAALQEMFRNEDIRPRDRLTALDMLNKMNGDYSERHDITINADVEIDRKTAIDAAINKLLGN